MKQPYHNDTDRFMHIGSVMIPPKCTRDVDPRLIPGANVESVPTDAPTSTLSDILKQNVAAVVLGLALLTDEELVELEALEKTGKNRNGVLREITHERLRRADASQTAPTEAPTDAPTEAPGQGGDSGDGVAGA